MARLCWLLCASFAGVAATAAAMEPWNAPYPRAERARPILFSTFQTPPRHLDPVSSYSENEAQFTGQIYEPPLQYHYLRRPYVLEPLTLREMPQVVSLDADGHRLPEDAPEELVSRVVYTLRVRPGIRYAPHPALARGENGQYLYHSLTSAELAATAVLGEFERTGTRELEAQDYVHQIKRLVHPGLHSPIRGFMERYIAGLSELGDELREAGTPKPGWLDLRKFELEGARVVDRHTFEIVLKERYPQFLYWLAMPFFAPVPWEADAFYAQPGMAERNLSLDWHPLGTGPYMLAENNPNRRMVLVRNPEFRGESYPSVGEDSDWAAGLLRDGGKAMPFVDAVHFILEKEDIPEWSKFLQGYYDTSPIAADGFDQAVRFNAAGLPEITPAMKNKGIRLSVATQMSVSYMGFNMLDPVVGGSGQRARRLRQALSIAVDIEEMISIFGNGRGVPAQGPLPPGIFGHREGAAGINPVVYQWRNGRPQRRPLSEAERLLSAAGYPHGQDPGTGAPLVLHLDATTTGPDSKLLFGWYRKQFAKLGLDLVVRSTDYNRFQERVLRGEAQIFLWGWNADYPDPENFLFLLNGPNGKARHQGENAANYANPEYDALFQRMRMLPDGAARQTVIDDMLAILRHDSPWIFGFHPQAYALEHSWIGNSKPHLMARNTLKYRRLDPQQRVAQQRSWNAPVTSAIWLPALLILAAVAVAGWRWRQGRTGLLP